MFGIPDTNSISDCWSYDATVFCISESTMRSEEYVCVLKSSLQYKHPGGIINQ